MNRLWVFILLLTFSYQVYAQQSQQRNVGSFSGIKVSEGIDVILSQGDKEAVRVEVAGNMKIENVITEVSGSYLKVHLESGNYRQKVDVKVYVTFVKLNKFSASSAGTIFSESPVKADDVEIQTSSAGSIELNLDARRIETSASSAGQIDLKGRGRSLVGEASSAGQIDAYDLECDEVQAEASSGGSIKVSVQNSLTANASSGGSVRYRGNPAKSVTHSSSGGSVKKSS